MSIQQISRSIWCPSWDCTAEKQQVYHNSVMIKRIKWTLFCLLDLKLCDGQYSFQLITAHFHFLRAVVKKFSFPHREDREGCGTGRKTRATRKASCTSPVQPSATEGEGSCNREHVCLLGLWGPFFQWDRWGQAKNKKGWRASEADTEESAETTDSQGAGGSEEVQPWDTDRVVQHFCNLKAEHYCIGNRSERKTSPSGQKKG